MKSRAIALSVDLGANQFLMHELTAAFDKLCLTEPNARQIAILILMRRSQELEPLPSTLESTDSPQLDLLDTALASVSSNCEARRVDNRWFCDKCLLSYSVDKLSTPFECRLKAIKVQK